MDSGNDDSSAHYQRMSSHTGVRDTVVTYRVQIALIGAIVLGVCLRLLPLALAFPLEVPLGGGGLYTEISQSILHHGFAYPTMIEHYTVGGVPFAYPPLVFYALAAIAALDISPVVASLIWMPFLFSIVTIPAFYWLATGVCSDQRESLLATFVYATIPAAFATFTAGEGVIEAVGTFCVLLGGGALVRTINHPNDTNDGGLGAVTPDTQISQRYVLLAGALFALTTLVSPGGAYAFVLALGTFGVALVINGTVWDSLQAPPRRAIRVAVLIVGTVGVIGLFGSAPWWATVASRHGIETLLYAFGSRQSLLEQVLEATQFDQFGAFWGALALVGAFYQIARRELFISLWFGITMFAGEIVYIRPIPVAILAAVAISRVVVPSLRSVTTAISLRSQRISASQVATGLVWIFVVLIIVHSTGMAAISVSGEAQDDAEPGTLAAMQWVEQETPSESDFLIVDPNPQESWWVGDWFPTFANRTAVDVRYGSEWTGNFTEQVAFDEGVNNATTLAELQTITRQHDGRFTHVFVRRRPGVHDLVVNLRQSRQATTVYRNNDAVIFRIEQQ
jgi:hypothetical protein